MVVKSDWVDGDQFGAADANAVAALVNSALRPFNQVVTVSDAVPVNVLAGDYLACTLNAVDAVLNLPAAPSNGDAVVVYIVSQADSTLTINSGTVDMITPGSGYTELDLIALDAILTAFTYIAADNAWMLTSFNTHPNVSDLSGSSEYGRGLLSLEDADAAAGYLGVEPGAEVNVNADWNASSGDGQILNKPTLGTAAATDATAYATAAQGAKADTALQAMPTGYVSGSVNGTATNTTLWRGTQAQYDAIGSKDSNTVYFVRE